MLTFTKQADATDELSHTNSARLFENLMRQSSRQAYALAYRLTGNAAEAEDLVQDSFIRAYRFFHRYDPSMAFTSWLFRIMSNAYIDQVRRRGRLKTTSLDQSGADGNSTWELADEESRPDKAMFDGALAEPVQQGLLAMNVEFRTAVLLADVEGMAYEEIAEVMRTSVGTVRSRIHRGRQQLRKYLSRHAPAAYAGYAS